jgi:hypothetical protein
MLQVGTVRIKGHKGQVITLTGVLWIPSNAMCLFSIKRASGREGTTVFHDDKCMIYQGQVLVFHTVKDPHSNYLSNEVLENRNAQDLLPPGFHLSAHAMVSHVHNAPAQIWHARYGHLSYRNMEKLLKKGLVHDMNVDPKEVHDCIGGFCEECNQANAKTKPSPTSDSPPSTKMLQLLHTDLMGPIPTSYDGKNYIMTVMDDY